MKLQLLYMLLIKITKYEEENQLKGDKTMIYFDTRYMKLYNRIIHNFLEIDIFGDEDIDIGDIIEDIVPKYLYREQYAKCEKVLKELYEWTDDKFYHDMSCFHELMLSNYLDYVAAAKDDYENFSDIYFDKDTNKMIEEASKKMLKEFGEEDNFTLEDIKEEFYDPYCYADALFTDLDFKLIDHLYNEQRNNFPIIAKRMGINLDFYFEILPMDIQEKYKSKHITLTGEISELLNFIQQRITYGSLSKLFWENDIPIKEERIQIILENLMEAYFYSKGVDITREALLGSGKVDFKLYRNGEESEKILLEIKKAKSSSLKAGYERQLIEYIKSSGCNNAFYLIACFTDKEYEKTYNFIRNHIYTDNFQMYININILDVRKKIPASKSIGKNKRGVRKKQK